VRAAAALTAFTNALVVSLIALDPVVHLGAALIAVAVVGMLFVAASLISFLRLGGGGLRTLREATFLIGLLVVFVLQLVVGIQVNDDISRGELSEAAILVVVSFLIGIARAWELIGAPNIGITGELFAAWRGHRDKDTTDEEDRR
jgi:hypothetical protein